MKNIKNLIFCIAFVLLTAILIGCGNSGSGSSNNPGANPTPSPVLGPYVFTYSTTDDDSHNHVIRMYSTALDEPPSMSWSDTSTTVSNHAHAYSVAKTQLISINSGNPVTITTQSAVNPATGNSHTHNGTISKTFNQASSLVYNHTHDITVSYNDLTNLPAAGVTYTTTQALNHTHNVTFSQAQLSTLNKGGSVTQESSAATDPQGNSHTHTYTNIYKPW